MGNIHDALQWRYATKQFDTTKKLTDEQISELLEDVRLSPSSFGLQPWKLIAITNPEVRLKLRAAAWGQPQVTDASHLIVFAAKTNLTEASVDEYIQLIAKTRNIEVEALSELSAMMKGSLHHRNPEQRTEWAARQAYIALGVLVAAAADAKIDVSPMEGFDPLQFNEILGLDALNLTASVIAGVGFRLATDPNATLHKVRFAKEDIITHIT